MYIKSSLHVPNFLDIVHNSGLFEHNLNESHRLLLGFSPICHFKNVCICMLVRFIIMFLLFLFF